MKPKSIEPRKWTHVDDGDTFKYSLPAILFMACCDCGLTHKIIVQKTGRTTVDFTFIRDKRRTGQMRRWHWHICQEKK